MPASPNARPRRTGDSQDVYHRPAAAEAHQDEVEPDEPDEPERPETERSDAEQAEPYPPDEGWEPV